MVKINWSCNPPPWHKQQQTEKLFQKCYSLVIYFWKDNTWVKKPCAGSISSWRVHFCGMFVRWVLYGCSDYILIFFILPVGDESYLQFTTSLISGFNNTLDLLPSLYTILPCWNGDNGSKKESRVRLLPVSCWCSPSKTQIYQKSRGNSNFQVTCH